MKAFLPPQTDEQNDVEVKVLRSPTPSLNPDDLRNPGYFTNTEHLVRDAVKSNAFNNASGYTMTAPVIETEGGTTVVAAYPISEERYNKIKAAQQSGM